MHINKNGSFVEIICTGVHINVVSDSLLPIDLLSSTVCIEQKSGLVDLASLSCAVASPGSIQWLMNYLLLNIVSKNIGVSKSHNYQ